MSSDLAPLTLNGSCVTRENKRSLNIILIFRFTEVPLKPDLIKDNTDIFICKTENKNIYVILEKAKI